MIKCIAVLSLLLYLSSCFAQDSFVVLQDVVPFKNKLNISTEQISTIECNFYQEKKLKMLTDKNISKGYFCYKKENNIRWEYLQPNQYLIVIKNGIITVKDNSKTKQYNTQSNKPLNELTTLISGCVQGTILNNTKDFSFSFFENSLQYFVKIVPTNSKVKKVLAEIHIYFDKTDLTIASLKMIEKGGDYTLIRFTKKKINKPIDDCMFIIKSI